MQPTQERLNKEQTRTSLERFTLNAGFRAIFDILCGGATFAFVAFASALGITNEKMGFITTTATVACILQMVAIPLGKRFTDKKRFMLSVAVCEPLFFTLAIIAVFFLPSSLRPYLIGIAVFLSAAAAHLSRPHTDEWFSSIIPAGIRGRYLGRRLQIYSASVVLSTLIAGWLIDHAIGRSNARGLSLLLIVGGISGLLSVIVLSGAFLPETSSRTVPSLNAFKTVITTPTFLRFLAFMFIFNIPFYFACPYYQVFNLQILKMPALLIAVMQTGYYLLKIIFMPVLGKIADKKNHVQILALTGILYTLFFMFFPFSSETRHWPILLAWGFVGLSDALFGITSQIMLYKSVPIIPSRQAFFAVYNLFTLIGYGIGSSLAVPFLDSIKGRSFHFGSFHLSNFHIFYAGCAVLMAATSFSVLLLKEPKKESIAPTAENAKA